MTREPIALEPPGPRRAFAATLAAVVAGDLLRRLVLAWLGLPWSVSSLGLGLAQAAAAGALAGFGLAWSRRRGLAGKLALAVGLAFADRAFLLGGELARGASFEAIDFARVARASGLEAAGSLALFVFALDARASLRWLGYVAFALARLGPVWPDQIANFACDLVGALETFQVLRKWLWSRRVK